MTATAPRTLRTGRARRLAPAMREVAVHVSLLTCAKVDVSTVLQRDEQRKPTKGLRGQQPESPPSEVSTMLDC